jgi:hypothetical protein
MKVFSVASGASRRLFYAVRPAPVFENSTAFTNVETSSGRLCQRTARGKSSSLPLGSDL